MIQFSDGSSDVELRLELGDRDVQGTKDIYVDANEDFLTVRLQCSGSPKTLMETSLYDKIKPAETIWYVPQSCQVCYLPLIISLSAYAKFIYQVLG